MATSAVGNFLVSFPVPAVLNNPEIRNSIGEEVVRYETYREGPRGKYLIKKIVSQEVDRLSLR